jgi:hypothetical protein
VLTEKLVLLTFLLVDTAYVVRILRREARALRRRMPRWHGPELFPPGCAAITAAADADAHAIRERLHERLDRWLDEHQEHRALNEEPSDPQHLHKRDAA